MQKTAATGELCAASFEGNEQRVRELLAAGEADINGRSRNGLTPLTAAASRCHVGVVDILLRQPSVDINKRNSDSLSPLMTASRLGYTAIVQRLLALTTPPKVIDVNQTGGATQWTALLLAASEGHMDVLRALLAHPDIDVNKRNADGHTALMMACTGKAEALKLLASDPRVDLELVHPSLGTAQEYAVSQSAYENGRILAGISESNLSCFLLISFVGDDDGAFAVVRYICFHVRVLVRFSGEQSARF